MIAANFVERIEFANDTIDRNIIEGKNATALMKLHVSDGFRYRFCYSVKTGSTKDMIAKPSATVTASSIQLGKRIRPVSPPNGVAQVFNNATV